MKEDTRKSLTKRQQQIYDYIVDCIEFKYIPPTRAEIANHFGFKSANAAEDHLRALANKGYIELRSGTSRGIALSKPLQEVHQYGLAVVGDVAAGEPILAQEHVQQYVNVEAELFSATPDFLLKVKGDSMVNIGIFEKDLLAIKKTNVANDNEIVVARIDDDVTVKRFFKNGKHVSLVAENDNYAPIEVDLSQQHFEIEGIVVGLIRQGL